LTPKKIDHPASLLLEATQEKKNRFSSQKNLIKKNSDDGFQVTQLKRRYHGRSIQIEPNITRSINIPDYEPLYLSSLPPASSFLSLLTSLLATTSCFESAKYLLSCSASFSVVGFCRSVEGIDSEARVELSFDSFFEYLSSLSLPGLSLPLAIELFETFDVDKKGRLGEREVAWMLMPISQPQKPREKLRQPQTVKQREREVFRLLVCVRKELRDIRALANRGQDGKNTVEHAFAQLDCRGKGALQQDDFVDVLGVKKDAGLLSFFNSCDYDDDGLISRKDFYKFFGIES